MNWLFPAFLAGGALVGLPVLLHFLRARPKTVVPFPSLRFLGETASRDTRRHRLQRWLTLLLRCLVIGLLAAAFARPFWNRHAAGRRALVVALDNSMSMGARGRWEAARDWALQQLDELRPGDRAALLAMHPAPSWIVPLTDDLPRVRAALRDVRPGFEKTRYAPALQTAADALAAVPATQRTLLWVADEQRLGWLGVDLNQPLPRGVELRLSPSALPVARQAALVGVRRLDAPSSDKPGGLVATVRLFAPEQDRRRVAVLAGGRTLAETTATLRAGDNPVELRFTAPPDLPGVRVALLEPDDLPADDTAWLARESTAGGRVLLDAVPGTNFLAHALRSTQRLNAGGLEPAPLPDAPWPAGAVTILRGPAAFRPPQSERLDRFMDAGGPLWLFVDGSPEQTAWLDKRGVRLSRRAAPPDGDAEHLRDWDPEHPVLAAFADQSLLPLLNVEFYGGFNLAGGALTPVANWPDGQPALAQWNVGGQRVLLAGFSLDRASTNWPAQPSFVPFVHRAVRWLGAAGAARNDWHVGDTLPLPEGAGTWRTLDAAQPAADRPVSGTVRPATPGLYEFVARSGVRKTFAVNPPPEESDLAPWPNPGQLAALNAPTDAPFADLRPPTDDALSINAEPAENQQRLWWCALAFCGVCVLAELALANRTAA